MRASIRRNGERSIQATPDHKVVAEQANGQRSIIDISSLRHRIPSGAQNITMHKSSHFLIPLNPRRLTDWLSQINGLTI